MKLSGCGESHGDQLGGLVLDLVRLRFANSLDGDQSLLRSIGYGLHGMVARISQLLDVMGTDTVALEYEKYLKWRHKSPYKVKFRSSLLVLRGAVGRLALLPPPPAAAVAVVVGLPVLPWLGNSFSFQSAKYGTQGASVLRRFKGGARSLPAKIGYCACAVW